jgi:hypothetical protein
MKVIINQNKKKSLTFTDLKVGTKFNYLDNKLMKIDYIGGYNTVDLDSGKLCRTSGAFEVKLTRTLKKEKKTTFNDIRDGQVFVFGGTAYIRTKNSDHGLNLRTAQYKFFVGSTHVLRAEGTLTLTVIK